MAKPSRHQRGWKSWFHAFFAAPRVTSGSRRRLRLESLEPRWVRSSFTVTDNSDSATDVNSLRYAIDHLASGSAASTNSITIESALTGGQTITLGSALDIDQGVTITGAGRTVANMIDDSVWISGGNAVGVFKVESGVNASFAGVNITKGTASAGGGIDNLGTLSLSNCSVSSNTATSTSSGGGGIYNDGGSLSVANCWIALNAAPSAMASGGGLYNHNGSVSISDSTIGGNYAGPFASPGGGAGGGVMNEAGTLSITNSAVESNTAGTNGGGIDNESTMSIANCTLTLNQAGSSGAALYNGNGSLSIADCTISGNSMLTNNASGIAGGIDNNATATVQNSIISNNSAPISPDAAGGFTDLGNNLLGTALDTGSPPASDVFTNNPGLMVVSRYDGGNIDTMAVMAGSPAIKAGSVLGGGIPTTDQLGDPRPTTGPIDIGAVQFLAVGSITGTVFDDFNGNGVQDPGESGVAGVTVYLDMMHSGHRDAYDPSAVTDGNGKYTFGGVQVGLLGSYTIREDAVSGSVNFTTPAGGGATVNLTTGAPTATVDFGQIETGGGSIVNQKYVAAVYQDVLGRASDAAGLDYWSKLLDSGMATSSVAYVIAHSDEYYANFVIRPVYLRLLNRAADATGVASWTQLMAAGLTDQQLEAGIVASDEFFANAGGTNTRWIDEVYQLLLGRPADTGGENYWNSQLASGETRIQAALGIAESTENNSQLINGDYLQYLGRPADPGGLVYWLNQFAAGQTNEDVIAGFTGSAEYYKEHTN